MSLVGAFTRLGQAPRYRRLWLQCVIGYTAAGLLSAFVVASVLTGAGRILFGSVPLNARLVAFVCVSLLLLSREMGWLPLSLPQRRRQTEKMWGNEFGLRTAAVMWGLDVGIGFATRVNYGGFWAIVAFVLLAYDSPLGPALMGCYWLGRALPVWMSPWIFRRAWRPLDLVQALGARSESMYARANAYGLVWAAVTSLLAIVENVRRQ